MDDFIAAIEVDRRRFLAAAGALAATAAAPKVLASSVSRLGPDFGPDLGGSLAAWVRWSPGEAARVVIGHRPARAAGYRPVADRPGAVATAPAEAVAAGREALASAVAPAWGAAPETLRVAAGEIRHEASGRAMPACIWLALAA